jgi:hypothetical protein
LRIVSGQWTKIVLKARVPAAMRLEWALQELEVAAGKRTGETAARRYIKSMPRDVRKRDQAQNMSSVLVNSITGRICEFFARFDCAGAALRFGNCIQAECVCVCVFVCVVCVCVLVCVCVFVCVCVHVAGGRL